MDVWGWILLYVVALVVFQVLVYRYLWTREDPFERTTPTARANSDGDGTTDRARHDRVRSEGSAGLWLDARAVDATRDRHCPHCGEENEPEPAFTFCWNCAGRLH